MEGQTEISFVFVYFFVRDLLKGVVFLSMRFLKDHEIGCSYQQIYSFSRNLKSEFFVLLYLSFNFIDLDPSLGLDFSLHIPCNPMPVRIRLARFGRRNAP